MRRLAAASRDEAGFTLVELLVVMVILGVVGAVTATGIIRGMQTTAHAQDRVEALAATQVVLERVSREVRAADPLCAIEAGAAALTVQRGGVAWHHRYTVESNGDGTWRLDQHRWQLSDPDDRCPDTVQGSPRTLVRALADDRVFTPLDRDGAAIATDPVAAANQARRVQLGVERVVQPDRRPIAVDTTVMLRNR